MKKIWNYKTKRYISFYTNEGFQLEQEYKQISNKELVHFLSKPVGYKLLHSFMNKRLNIPKMTSKTTGAVIDFIRKYDSKTLAYVYLFIQLCNYRTEKGLCPTRPSDKIYLVKGFYQNVIHFFNNDSLIPIPRELFDVSYQEMDYFYNSFSKHERLSQYFNYDIALYSEENYWYDIPPYYLFVINDYCFDLRWLMNVFKGQLNSSKNNMPYPAFLYNPMTRVPLSDNILVQLKKIINSYHDLSFIPDIVNYFIQKRHELKSSCPFDIICLLENKYRFQKLNVTDSQENYTGQWVLKSEPLTPFELQFEAMNERNILHNFQEALEEEQNSLFNLFSSDYLIRRFQGFT